MTPRPRSERITQNRVVGLFTANVRSDCLGYRYLGDWKGRAGNRCIESGILRTNLKDRGYTPAQIAAAIQVLEAAADPTGTTLYQANQRTYQLIRLGADVQTTVGEPHAKVHFIDWDDVERNDFALAEEVTPKEATNAGPTSSSISTGSPSPSLSSNGARSKSRMVSGS